MKKFCLTIFIIIFTSINSQAFIFDFINATFDYLSNLNIRSKESTSSFLLDNRIPENISYSQFGNSLIITWTPPFQSPKGYNIYQKSGSKSSYQKLNESPIISLDFQLTLPDEQSFFYITAVYDNSESNHSEILIFTPNNTLTSKENSSKLHLSKTYQKPMISFVNGEHQVFLKDLLRINEPGNPVLPIDSIKVLIPANKKFKSFSYSYKSRQIEGSYSVEYQKVSQPTEYQPTLLQEIPKNETVYQSENYPVSPVQKVSLQSLHGYKILVLNVFPVIYHPLNKSLEYMYNLDISVDLEDSKTLSSQNFRKSNEDEQRVLRKISNPDDINSYHNVNKQLKSSSLSGGSYLYMIITTDDFAPYYQQLIDYRNSKQIPSILITTSYINNNYTGTQQQRIRDFIRDAYNDWGIQYVLLGGDHEFIPGTYTYAKYSTSTDSKMLTDAYYGCLDGNWDANNNGILGEPDDDIDYHAEVFIGRHPASLTSHITSFINKVISYESTDRSNPYLKQIGLYGEQMDAVTWGGDSMEELADDISPTYNIKKFYEKNGYWGLAEVANNVNAGYHFIFHLGHSAPNSNMQITMGNIRDHFKNSKYYILYTQGCYPASFDNLWWDPYRWYNTGDSIGEMHVNFDKGAVAFIGNTRYGWYSRGYSRGSSTIYQEDFVKEIFQRGTKEIGKALQISKEYLADYNNYFLLWHFYTITLLGDPIMQIHNDLNKDLFTELKPLPNWISSSVKLQADVLYGEGIPNKVEFQYSLNKTTWITINTDTTNPFEFIWDTTSLNTTKIYLRVIAYTNIGETTVSKVIEQNIDNKVPNTSFTGNTGWFNEPVEILLNESDDGVGIDKTYYSLDGSIPSLIYSSRIYLNKTGKYNIKFYSVDKVGNIQQTQTIPEITINSNIQTGWPYTSNGAIYGAPTIADIDKDGEDEIIFGSNDGKVHVVKSDGTPAYGWPQNGFTAGASSAAIGDIDGDGDLEIVIGGAYSGILAFHHTGTSVQGFPVLNQNNIPFNSSPCLADINNDGKLDIIMTAVNKLYIYNNTGQILQGWPQTLGNSTEDCFSSPSAADIDSDGDLEIFVGSKGNSLFGFHHNGTLIQGWPVILDSEWIMSSPIIANIDNDPSPEIIIGGGKSKKLYVFNIDGTIQEGFPITGEGYFLYTPALGDIDNDNKLEIVIGNLMPRNNKIYIISGDGSLTTIPVTFNISSAAIIGDINNDGSQEIIIGSDNNNIYAIKNSIINTWTIDGTISLSPSFGDINGDNQLDLIAGSWDGKLYVFNLNSPITKIDWKTFKHNNHHTGTYPTISFKNEQNQRIGDTISLNIDSYGNSHKVVYEYSKDKVSFIKIAEVTNFPYSLVWNSKDFITDYDGPLYIKSYFIDSNGNKSIPHILNLTLDNKLPDLSVIAKDTPNDNGKQITIQMKSISSDFEKFKVYRTTQANSTNQEYGDLIYQGTDEIFTDTNLINNTTYFYTVIASDGINENVSQLEIIPIDNTPPSLPTEISIKDNPNDNGKQILVSWNESLSNDIISYTIFKGTSSSVLTKLTSTTKTSFIDSTDDSKSYYYKLQVNDGTFTTDSQIYGPIKSVDNLPPAQVTNITQTFDNDKSQYISFSWTNPTDPDLQKLSLYKNGVFVKDLSKDTASFKDTAIFPNINYVYTIKAHDFLNYSTATKTLIYIDRTPPEPVTNLIGTDINDQGGSIKLTWNLSADDSTDVKEYIIHMSTNSIDSNLVAKIEPGKSEFIKSGLVDTVKYFFRILSVDTAGNQSISDWSNGIIPLDNIAPDTPSNFKAYDKADDNGYFVELSWDSVNDAKKYKIYYSEDNKTFSSVEAIASTELKMNENKTYFYKVSALDSSNESIHSNVIQVEVKDNIQPIVPELTVIDTPNDQGNSLSISWTNSSSDVKSYSLYKSTDNISFKLLKETSETSFTDDTNCLSYYYIQITDGTYTLKSTIKNCTPIDNIVSSPKLTFEDIPNDQGTGIKLIWTISDNDIKQFNVFKNDVLIQTTTKNYHSIITSKMNTYYVQAIDKSNNINNSNIITATPIDNIPPDPVTLTVTDIPNDQGTSLKLTWTKSSNLLYYTINKNGQTIATTNLNEFIDSTSNKTDYQIGCYDGTNTSLSNKVSMKPIDNIPPDKTTVKVNDVPYDGGGKVEVSWNPIDNIIGYKLFYSRDNLTWISIITDQTNFIADIDGTWFFKVQTYDGTYSVDSEIVKGTEIDNRPDAPSNITVIDIPNDQGNSLKISWSSVENITEYTLFKSYENDFKEVITTKETSFIDTVEYKQVYYKVRSNTQHINSELSSLASGTPIDNINPTLPTNFNGSDVENDNGGKIKLSWLKSNSEDLSSYIIYKDGNKLIETASLSIELSDDEQNHSYKIQSKDIHGLLSNLSSEIVIKSIDNIAEPVTELKAYDTPYDNGGSITVSWKKSLDEGKNLVSYKLYRKSADDWKLLKTFTTGEIYIDQVENGVSYIYKIIVEDSLGNSNETESNISVAQDNYKKDDSGFPETVIFKVEDVLEDEGGTLQIFCNDTANNNYSYSLMKLVGDSYITIKSFSQVPFQFLDNCNGTQTYKLKIITNTAEFLSPSISGKAIDNIPPQSATELTIKDVPNDEGTGLEISWKNSISKDVIYHKLYKSIDNKTWTYISDSNIIDKVVKGTRYYYKVEVSDNDNVVSTISYGEAIDNIPPANITNFIGKDAENDRGGQIILSWIKSDSNDVKEYFIYRKSDSEYQQIASLQSSVSTYIDLVDNSSYYYYIKITDGNNDTYSSEIGPIQAIHNKPKSAAPTELNVSDVNGDQGKNLQISWKKSNDDGSGFNDVIGYNVYRSLNGVDFSLLKFVTSNIYIDSSLVNNKTYFYYVTAKNAFVESDKTNTKSGNPIDNIPPVKISEFKVVDLQDTNGKISLSWKASSSADVEGYRINKDGVELVKISGTNYIDNVENFRTHKYSIEVYDSNNSVASEEISCMAYPDKSYNAGYNLVSIPFETTDQIKSIIGKDGFTYNGEQYITGQNSLGRGFIVKLDEVKRTEFTNGTFNNGEYEIKLNKFWNLIGNPYNFAIDLIKTKVRYNSEEYSFGEAVELGLIQGEVWSYNGTYIKTTQMKPFYGYWILAYESVSLVYMPIESTLKVSDSDNFTQLVLDIDGKEIGSSLIGVAKDAKNGIDRYDIGDPPVIGDYAKIYFKEKVEKIGTLGYKVDIKEEAVSQVWEASFKSNLSEKVRLTFRGLNKNYDTIIYLNNRKVVVDKDTKIYLSNGENFKIQMVSKTSANDFEIKDVINYPNPFDPRIHVCKIKYTLTKNAKGSIKIFSIVGKQVKDIEIDFRDSIVGENIVEWDGRDNDGDILSNGAYFYLMVFEDSEGNSLKHKGKIVIWK